jgi:acyl-coenzyme A synthetase/AMP-(fatty) acid ligase
MRKRGVKKNDVVALMMDNRPEFIFALLASAKVGSTIALINTNLRHKPLIHSLVTSDANLFFVGIDFLFF